MHRLLVALLGCLFVVSLPWACSSSSTPDQPATACAVGQTSCGTSCASTLTDAANCGACGKACSTGQQCVAGACQCAAGLSNCNGKCVNLSNDPANCSACGVACGTGLFCVAGAGASTCSASCPLTTCGSSCINTTADVLNCGACAHACGAGQTCSNSVCACALGQTLCNGVCQTSACTGTGGAGGASSAGAGGASGASGASGANTGGGTGGASTGGASTGGANTGGSAGSAGTAGAAGSMQQMPVALTCPVNGAMVNIPAADVISDFRLTPLMYKVGTRGGTEWYSYGAEDSTSTPPVLGASTPGAGSNAFAIDAATSGPCNSGGSLKISSKGNSLWGVGFGVNLMDDVAGTTMKDKFDAKAAGYTGIGYFMKCQAETDFFYVKTVDVPNDADVQNPICSYSGTGTICNQYGQKNTTQMADWTYQKVYFGETLQDWDGGTITSGIKSDQLTAFQMQVNTQYTRDGGTRVANPFTCWIDDVHFIKDMPPSASVAPKTCTSGTAAPGGYYVTGNKIMDCKTGQQKIFHGVARPSFEWDRAGWNINYADLARIAAMKANVVRFSLNQSYWLDAAKGALYQAYVDRAVKWTLALGMDVILDLHWLENGQTTLSDDKSPTFWTQVATKYKGDGRVMFELFNEPYGVSASVWHDKMQAMYTAVRTGAGANNLVFMGGLDYAYKLSDVIPGNIVTGTNIAYVTHPYDIKTQNNNNNIDTAAWDAAFGNLAATYPIVATEFGQANTTPGGTKQCSAAFYNALLTYFKGKNIGWTAWAWFVDRAITTPENTCGFPQMITSYSGTTNSAGTAIKAAF